jgi:hypothetical protein
MEPTMGRIVHYTPPDPNDVNAVEAPAIVSRVNGDDGTVDLTVFPHNGAPYSATAAESESGQSENGKWNWPPAAPTGSAPEAGSTDEPKEPADEVGGGNEGSPANEGGTGAPDGGTAEGEQSTGTGGNTVDTGAGSESPTTSAASERPLYRFTGDGERPAGFNPSGLETPEGDTLYHYADDTAGEPHKFDLASDQQVALYAETDDNEQPVKPAAESTVS